MKAIYTLCPSPDVAQRTVDALYGAGVAAKDVIVFSSEPFEHDIPGQTDRAMHLGWVSVLGGGAGFVIAVALVGFTQLAWPLNTGGMPILSVWPDMIPVFEITMLGAVVATIAGFLVTARLPRRLPEVYDPQVSDGKILVGVVNPSADRLGDIERTLAGIGELKRIE